MHAWARSSLFFAAGFWTALVLIGGVAIYGFDYFEAAWRRGPSLQVHIWIATLGAVVSLFAAGFGFRLGGSGGTVLLIVLTAFGIAYLASVVKYLLAAGLDCRLGATRTNSRANARRSEANPHR